MTISHSAKLTLCVTGSCVLHALVLQQMSVASIAVPQPPKAAAVVSARYIAAPAKVSPPAPAEANVNVANQPQPPNEIKTAPPLTPSSAPVTAPGQTDEVNPSPQSAKTYYTSNEVDSVAAPETDWPITVSQGLGTGLVYEAKVSIWVNSEGNIDRLEIVNLEPESQRVRSAIEAMVGIILQPATRGGLAVPSQQTIELLLPE
jgi:outer membrane biosynthesis protein TonB